MKKHVSRNHYDIAIANAKGKKSWPFFRDHLLNRKNKDVVVPSNLIADTISLYLTFLVMFSKSSDYTKTLTCKNGD